MKLDGPAPSYTLVGPRGVALGTVELRVPGRHNVLNSLVAAATALEEGLPFDAVQAGLLAFRGVDRRYDRLGEVGGVLVMDDYAHHPTEIAATLDAARRALNRPLIVVFQPHLFSRTRLLLEEFAGSFHEADRVLIAHIYAAREEPDPTVDGALLAERIAAREPGKPVEYIAEHVELVERLRGLVRPGDVVLTMGAGDIREVGVALVQQLGTEKAVGDGRG